MLIRERGGTFYGGEVQEALSANTRAVMRKDHIEAPGAAVFQGEVAGNSKLLHPACATRQRRNRAACEHAEQLTQHAVEVEDAAGYCGEVHAVDFSRPHGNITIVAGAQADERAEVVRHTSLEAGDLVRDLLCSGNRAERDDESNGDSYSRPASGSARDIPFALGW